MKPPATNCPLCRSSSVPIGKKQGRRTGREFSITRCTGCGFAWVVDPWTEFDVIYDDAYYAGHGSDPLVDYSFEHECPHATIRRAEWRGLLRIVETLAPEAERWLDFGCGNGGLVRHAAAHSKVKVCGFDSGSWAARARADGLPILTEEELGALDGQFDVVTCVEVIEHVIDPVPFLKNIRAKLRRGGLLFLTTGNAAKAPREFSTWGYVNPEIHVSYFTPQALASALSSSGFRAEPTGFVAGFEDVIRFKVLKALGQKRNRAWHDLVPWSAVSRLVDQRHGVSAMPAGRAI